MNDIDELIRQVRVRAESPSTRTDPDTASPHLYPCASQAAVEEAERQLDFPLHPLHRRLFLEVGNGGFGPGFGILGIAGGHLHDGKSIVELKREPWSEVLRSGLPARILPLCDWGDAMWSCIDSASREGVVITASNGTLTVTSYTLATWLEDWVKGVDVFKNLFEILEAPGINPFTRQPMIYTSPGPAKGVPYRAVS